MGRLSIVAGLLVGIVAAVLLLGGLVLLAPVGPAGPSPTPFAAATPVTSSSPSASASPLPSAVVPASVPGVTVTP
jgi:hypothetical protein